MWSGPLACTRASNGGQECRRNATTTKVPISPMRSPRLLAAGGRGDQPSPAGGRKASDSAYRIGHGRRTRPLPQPLPPAGCHPRIPISMSVPGTAADVSTSYYDSISTVPGTGPDAWKDPLDFSAPMSPRRSPRLPGMTLCGPYGCGSLVNIDRTTSNPARPINAPAPSGWKGKLSTFDF